MNSIFSGAASLGGGAGRKGLMLKAKVEFLLFLCGLGAFTRTIRHIADMQP